MVSALKSFQAKMYIEDGMATIDFDIQIPKINSVPTEEDAGDKFDIKDDWSFAIMSFKIKESEPGFIILCIIEKPKEGIEPNPKPVGTMTCVNWSGDFDVEQAKKETIDWLDLQYERKLCIKYNFQTPKDSEYHLHDQKFVYHPRNSVHEGKIDVFLKEKNGEWRFVRWNVDDISVFDLGHIKRKREMISNNDLHFFDLYDDEEKYRNNMNR